ncbi:MAG: cupin domain-containing protein [Elusimicrobia bacterium]|nr:cupin domain-containing protein [Elusimicrobiota bacterium]
MRPALAALLILAGPAAAQAPGSPLVLKHPEEIQWKVSGSLPPGAEYHLVYEDPVTHAVQTLVRFPSGYTLPPHFHTHDETILVIKGKLVVEQAGSPTTLGPESYAAIPSGLMHSLKAKSACVLFVTVTGPYDVKGLPSVK